MEYIGGIKKYLIITLLTISINNYSQCLPEKGHKHNYHPNNGNHNGQGNGNGYGYGHNVPTSNGIGIILLLSGGYVIYKRKQK